jgi:hypothetical protein
LRLNDRALRVVDGTYFIDIKVDTYHVMPISRHTGSHNGTDITQSENGDFHSSIHAKARIARIGRFDRELDRSESI